METFTKDDDQEKAVRSVKNTVVTAGAGSGKTRVLARRFIHLLKHHQVAIDEILTLTFTNKASAEMYERIYQTLLPETDPRLKQALLDFHLAQISTIDSFCAQVARSAAARFGLPEDFAIDEEAVRKLSEEAALDFYLARSGRPSVELLVGKYGLPAFCSEILGRIARQSFSLAEATDFTGLLKRQYARLESALAPCLNAYEAACAGLLHDDFKAFKTVSDNRSALSDAGRARDLVSAGRWEEASARLPAVNLRKPGGKASPAGERLKELIDRVKAESETLAQLVRAFAEREIRADWHDLLDAFQKTFHEKQRSAGLASFSDVARMAVVALRDHPPLRRYYKNKYRFIMIDEFQDNNHLQKELLFLLAEKRSLSLDRVPGPDELEPDKLFFVGDEKQSIYGFRGAEVDVFKALKKELAGRGGEVVSLRRNYRSRPGLVAFFNRVFTRVMERPAFAFEAEYESLVPAVAAGARPPEVLLFYKNAAAGDGPAEEEDEEAPGFENADSEAFALADFIRRSVKEGAFTIEEEGRSRTADYPDFALLLRSTGNQIIFERMFRHLGIPYETQDIRSLFMEPPVNDIYSLLECALHPDDRPAYAALLRSPFVSLSDGALLTVLGSQAEPFAAAALEPEDAVRFDLGRERYLCLRERLDRLPVSRLVFHAWYELGYRYHILRHPSAAMYLEYYDYLYALALRADERGQTLEEFLAWIRANLGRYEKLEEIDLPQTRSAGVKIMTIHKAKGLQFPIVIAANLGTRGRGRERKAPVSFSAEFGPVVNLGEGSFLTREAEEEEGRRELAELKRLLYVALTRAEHHLVLSGVHTKSNRNSERVLLTMLFRALELTPEEPGRFSGGEYHARLVPIPDLTEEVFKQTTRTSGRRELSALAREFRDAPEPVRRWRRTEYTVTELNELHKKSFAEKEYEARRRELPALNADKHLTSDEARARWGTLAHYVIHQKILSRYARDAVPFGQRAGFSEKEFESLAAEAEALADRFLASRWGQRYLAAGEKATEFPFLFRYTRGADDFFIRGAIDLYFIEEGRAVLLDFKTDRFLNPLEYEVQLGIYRAALAAYTRLPAAASLYSLRSGETTALPEEFDLDRFFSRIETLL